MSRKKLDPPAYVAIQVELDPLDRELLGRFVCAVQKIAAAMLHGSGGGMTEEQKAELAADAAAIMAKIEASGKSLDDEVDRLKETK